MMSTLITPEQLQTKLPLLPHCRDTVTNARRDIIRILSQQDDRLLVVVGPCSIHHTQSALAYAEKLRTQIDKHGKNLHIVMRAYLEKARTSTGWKGFINDPALNGTFQMEEGLYAARALLLSINALGVPTGSEILNPYTAHYFTDLTSWAAIGARTTESQIHREIAASLPMPVGFKNNTSGDIQVAIDATRTALQPHHFLGATPSGQIMMQRSNGNPHCHVVLRGSQQKTNYDPNTIAATAASLAAMNLHHHVMIDCSHGNCEKEHSKQMTVIDALSSRLSKGDRHFFGVMLESHLTPGKQAWHPRQVMRHDQSITDACIGWEETESALDMLSAAVQKRREIVLD